LRRSSARLAQIWRESVRNEMVYAIFVFSKGTALLLSQSGSFNCGSACISLCLRRKVRQKALTRLERSSFRMQRCVSSKGGSSESGRQTIPGCCVRYSVAGVVKEIPI
jgi:hypothetical protein